MPYAAACDELLLRIMYGLIEDDVRAFAVMKVNNLETMISPASEPSGLRDASGISPLVMQYRSTQDELDISCNQGIFTVWYTHYYQCQLQANCRCSHLDQCGQCNTEISFFA